MLHAVEHALEHTLEDSILVILVLFFTYLVMEYLEHHAGDKLQQMVEKAGKLGPVIGAVAGVVPQCGFSAAALSGEEDGIFESFSVSFKSFSSSFSFMPRFLILSLYFAISSENPSLSPSSCSITFNSSRR